MKNSHSFTEIKIHLVLKTTRCIPFGEIKPQVEYWVKKSLARFEVNVIKFGIADNHIHLLFELHPSSCLSDLIDKIKSNSSLNLNKYFSAQWPGWRRGYWCASVGGSSLSRVKKYISNQ